MMSTCRGCQSCYQGHKKFYYEDKLPQKKNGQKNIKYIYILAFDGKVRPHFHILMTGEGVDRDELEDMWKKCDRKILGELSQMRIFDYRIGNIHYE